MGQAEYLQDASVRELFERADALLPFSLSGVCFDGPIALLTETRYQTPANYVVGLARWRLMQGHHDWPAPSFVVGQSMGLVTALAAVGAVTFEDGLHLAERRGALMADAGATRPGAMAAVLGISAEITTAVCAEIRDETGLVLQLANDNSPVHQNIAGEVVAVEAALLRLKAAGARKTVRLPISIASHCDLMEEMAGKFASVVATVPFMDAEYPLVSNVSAEIISIANDLKRETVAHLTRPVRWRESMLRLRRLGVDTFIDVGPGDSLAKLMKRIDRSAQRMAYQV